MEYTVAESYQVVVMIQTVNKLLAEGWSLHGGVAVANGEGTASSIYAQALIRETGSSGADFVSSGEKQDWAKVKDY
jgi:hypothetical protein